MLTPKRRRQPYCRGVPGEPRSWVRTLGVDALFAAALTAFMVVGTVGAANEQNVPAATDLEPLTFVLVAVAGVGVALRRVRPLVALAVTVAATATYLAEGYPYGPILFSVVISTYSVASRLPVRRSLPAWVAAAAVLAVPFATDLDWRDWIQAVAQVAAWTSWTLTAWAIGVVARTLRSSREQSRAQRQRQQAYEERLRTAQDVHDIVGHGLAAISMQAGVALHVLDRSPERTRELLETIRQSSQHSLDELRATLAVFRAAGTADAADSEADAAARAPLPGLDRLDGLVARMADSGVPVRLTRSGSPVPLLGSVDNAAYRILQESLTNVLRHAGATTATVHLGYSADRLTLEVTDRGRRSTGNGSLGNGSLDSGTTGSDSTGQGLAGMRARAEGLGGSLRAGPGESGGFRVRAELPLGDRS